MLEAFNNEKLIIAGRIFGISTRVIQAKLRLTF